MAHVTPLSTWNTVMNIQERHSCIASITDASMYQRALTSHCFHLYQQLWFIHFIKLYHRIKHQYGSVCCLSQCGEILCLCVCCAQRDLSCCNTVRHSFALHCQIATHFDLLVSFYVVLLKMSPVMKCESTQNKYPRTQTTGRLKIGHL